MQIAKDRISPPVGVEDLYQGSDRFEVHAKFKARKHLTNHPYKQDTGYSGSIKPTWNEMFAAVAPTMINETPDDVLKQALRDFLRQRGIDQWKDTDGLKGLSLVEFEFRDDEIDTSIVQFRALGLIRESQKNRSVKDIRTFWALTPYGDQLMTQLRALRRPPLEKTSGTRAKAMTDTGTAEKKKTARRSAEKKK